MTDIIERARMLAALFHANIEPETTLHLAADEIERLRSKLDQSLQAEQGAVLEIERLRKGYDHYVRGMKNWKATAQQKDREIERLRAALDAANKQLNMLTKDCIAREALK